jgi:MRC1-like domain
MEKDQTDISNILNDVTSGALRKRRGKRLDPNGKGLDLYDSDEENEALLRQIRKRMGLQASKKRKNEDEGPLQSLGF